MPHSSRQVWRMLLQKLNHYSIVLNKKFLPIKPNLFPFPVVFLHYCGNILQSVVTHERVGLARLPENLPAQIRFRPCAPGDQLTQLLTFPFKSIYG